MTKLGLISCVVLLYVLVWCSCDDTYTSCDDSVTASLQRAT